MSDSPILLKDAISSELCNFLSTQFQIVKHADIVSGDYHSSTDNSELFSKYSPPFLDTLLVFIQPLIEHYCQLKLLPTYSFGRIYGQHQKLLPHFDHKPSSEIAVSCCLSTDHPWSLDFYFDDNVNSVFLDIGDIVIYRGSITKHGRLPFCGNEYIGAFLFYVDAHGPLNHLIYDTRPCLASSRFPI